MPRVHAMYPALLALFCSTPTLADPYLSYRQDFLKSAREWNQTVSSQERVLLDCQLPGENYDAVRNSRVSVIQAFRLELGVGPHARPRSGTSGERWDGELFLTEVKRAGLAHIEAWAARDVDACTGAFESAVQQLGDRLVILKDVKEKLHPAGRRLLRQHMAVHEDMVDGQHRLQPSPFAPRRDSRNTSCASEYQSARQTLHTKMVNGLVVIRHFTDKLAEDIEKLELYQKELKANLVRCQAHTDGAAWNNPTRR